MMRQSQCCIAICMYLCCRGRAVRCEGRRVWARGANKHAVNGLGCAQDAAIMLVAAPLALPGESKFERVVLMMLAMHSLLFRLCSPTQLTCNASERFTQCDHFLGVASHQWQASFRTLSEMVASQLSLLSEPSTLTRVIYFCCKAKCNLLSAYKIASVIPSSLACA
jgi:hypothetical protein